MINDIVVLTVAQGTKYVDPKILNPKPTYDILIISNKISSAWFSRRVPADHVKTFTHEIKSLMLISSINDVNHDIGRQFAPVFPAF